MMHPAVPRATPGAQSQQMGQCRAHWCWQAGRASHGKEQVSCTKPRWIRRSLPRVAEKEACCFPLLGQHHAAQEGGGRGTKDQLHQARHRRRACHAMPAPADEDDGELKPFVFPALLFLWQVAALPHSVREAWLGSCFPDRGTRREATA